MENEEIKTDGISNKLFALNLALLGLVLGMSFVVYNNLGKNKTKEVLLVDKNQNVDVFNNLNLQAKAVYVYDVASGKALFKKNEFVQLPLASITKLMTALVAVELFPKDSRITIRDEFLKEEGDSGLLRDESWKLKDLLDFSLVTSSNDGVRSIASVVGAFDLKSGDYNLGRKDFINKMNAKADELGLLQTYFVNESGLDDGIISGGNGSAQDVATLLVYMLKNNPQILEATKYPELKISSANKTHKAENTNTIINSIPSLIASKTGYTDMAGGNLAIVFDASIGRPIVVVVLGSTQEGRFSDVSLLVKASLKYISS